MKSASPGRSRRRLGTRLASLMPVRAGEGGAVGWSFLYFFCLLGGYYVLRPVRDTMGVAGGVEHLQWLFTGTFVAMCAAVPLYGWLASRVSRRVLLPAVYGFFILDILIFYGLFRVGVAEVGLARVFFIWTSVFNLFVVSVFWSFMADIYSTPQARRLFGFIAAGGSAGAIAGPLLTTLFAGRIGTINLLPVAAAILAVALVAIMRLRRWAADVRHAPGESRLGGGALEGLRRLLASRYLAGVGGFIVLYTLLSTFLYFQQARIVEQVFTSDADRTAAFATIDFAVNTLTVGLQLFATHQVVHRLGLPGALAGIPLLVAAGFVILGLAPAFVVLLGFQVLRRAGNYAITRPAREMLFTVLPRADKYKTKNVLDTVVYRGGDAVSAWVFTGLSGIGLGLSGTAAVGAGVALVWAALGFWLGLRQQRLADNDRPRRSGVQA